jgi:hypothetical protein
MHRFIDEHPEFPKEWYPMEESGEFTGYFAEMPCHMATIMPNSITRSRQSSSWSGF